VGAPHTRASCCVRALPRRQGQEPELGGSGPHMTGSLSVRGSRFVKQSCQSGLQCLAFVIVPGTITNAWHCNPYFMAYNEDPFLIGVSSRVLYVVLLHVIRFLKIEQALCLDCLCVLLIFPFASFLKVPQGGNSCIICKGDHFEKSKNS